MSDDDLLTLFGGELAALFGDGADDGKKKADSEPEELTTADLLASLPRKKEADDRAVAAENAAPAEPAQEAMPEPTAAIPADGAMIYVGFDDQTKTNFRSNFADNMQFIELFELKDIKEWIVSGQVAVLVFDPTSFIKPGVAITRFIKEKSLPLKVVHVISEPKITEEYAKYRQYHLHLQPDYATTTDEIFSAINQLKGELGIAT